MSNVILIKKIVDRSSDDICEKFFKKKQNTIQSSLVFFLFSIIWIYVPISLIITKRVYSFGTVYFLIYLC